MNCQKLSTAMIVTGSLIWSCATVALQTQPMLPVQPKPDNSFPTQVSWRSTAHLPSDQDGHLPLPPPVYTRSNHPTSGSIPHPASYQQDLDLTEEIQGIEVRGTSSGQEGAEQDEEYFETSGSIEVINQRYPDGQVQVKRHVMLTIEGNYVNHGVWQLYNRRGQVLAEGNFDQGQMQGGWQRWHSTDDGGMFTSASFREFTAPFLSQASFSDGELSGKWKITDQFRRTIVEMNYRDGVRQGTFVWFRPNNTKLREMTFENGVPHGSLREWDAQNTMTRDDLFIHGKKVVREVTNWRPNQPKTEDYYLEAMLEPDEQDDWWNARFATYRVAGDRIRHGLSSAWYENGQPKMRVNYRHGLQDGRYYFWHPNGQKRISGVYESGLKQGRWIWWHENGIKAIEVAFSDDIPIGEIKRWNSDGTVEAEPIDALESLPGDYLEELRPPVSDQRFPLESDELHDGHSSFSDFFGGT